MNIFDVNSIAFFLAFFANVAIGYLWYTPRVFGAVWRQEQGLSEEVSVEEQARIRQAMVPQILAMFSLSWFMGLISTLMLKGLMPGGTWALSLVCFVALTWASRLFLGKNHAVALIDSGYIGVTIVVSFMSYTALGLA